MTKGAIKLKELLRREGRTVKWLIERSGISRSTIDSWDESAPSIDKLWHINATTGIDMMEIVECFRPETPIEPDLTGGDEN